MGAKQRLTMRLMKSRLGMALVLLSVLIISGAAMNDIAKAAECEPTPPDSLGPMYKAGAPERSKVGDGLILKGSVKSAEDCRPLPGAKVEFWMVGPDGNYGDEYRATVIAGESGQYRFESHHPSGYSGRPPHIHIRVTTEGQQVFVTQFYPKPDMKDVDYDLVIRKE